METVPVMSLSPEARELDKYLNQQEARSSGSGTVHEEEGDLKTGFHLIVGEKVQTALRNFYYQQVLAELGDAASSGDVSGGSHDISAEVEDRTAASMSAIFRESRLIEWIDENEPAEDETNIGDIAWYIAETIVSRHLSPPVEVGESLAA